MFITLQQIRDQSPCSDGWKKVFTAYGPYLKTTVSIGDIAKSNDAQDALWSLRCAEFDRRDILRAILPSVKRASIHTTDKRVHDCISAIEKWIAGDETIDLRKAADAAADAAAYAADAAADAAVYAAAADAAVYAADAAVYAADAAAYAADAAAVYAAAADAARAAADAARAAELKLQIEDICAVWPVTR